MMENNTELIDMHCHLLPGVDDGAKDMADTLTALHTAEEQGVKKIIMTPHFYPNKSVKPEKILELTQQVREAARAEQIPIEIFSGMECMYFSELPALLESGEVLPLAGSRYVLVEFPQDFYYQQIEKGLESIFEVGYTPVLAHYERYLSLAKGDKLTEIKRNGCLLQMNYDTVQQRYGLFRQNPFHKDLKEGLVDFLSSDCHGSHYREYSLPESFAWLRKNVSKDILYKLTYGNAVKILENRYGFEGI